MGRTAKSAGSPEAKAIYIAGFVIPVPERHRDAYRRWAQVSAALFLEYGCLEIVESWEDFVPDGALTDFRRAVQAEAGEKIVFSWQIWPDKESLEAVEAKMREDKRFEPPSDLPFDAKRLIYGCFVPVYASRFSKNMSG